MRLAVRQIRTPSNARSQELKGSQWRAKCQKQSCTLLLLGHEDGLLPPQALTKFASLGSQTGSDLWQARLWSVTKWSSGDLLGMLGWMHYLTIDQTSTHARTLSKSRQLVVPTYFSPGVKCIFNSSYISKVCLCCWQHISFFDIYRSTLCFHGNIQKLYHNRPIWYFSVVIL